MWVVAEKYQEFDIRYLPSKRFGMRYGAYAQDSSKAFVIRKSLLEAKQALDRNLGNLSPELGAAVLRGKSPGPRPYDAVLGGKASSTIASGSIAVEQAEIILTRSVARQISINHCWGHRGCKYFGCYPTKYEIDYLEKQPKLIASKKDMPKIMQAFSLQFHPPHSQPNRSNDDDLLDDDWEIIED